MRRPETAEPNARTMYADRIVVQYSQVDFPGEPPGNTLILMVSPGEPFNLDELRAEIEQINFDTQPDGSKTHTPFVLDMTVRKHSWGAASTVVSFVLLASASGVIGSVTWEGLKSIGSSFVERVRARSQVPQRPLSEDEAAFWAASMAQRRFELAYQPEVTKVQFDDPDATVWMSGPDGSKYVVEVQLIEGLAALGSISREYPTSEH